MDFENIDWEKINKNLPHKKTPEEKELRKKLFQQFDPNGNGFLSLAEVDKGVRDILGLKEIFLSKPVLIRAFNAAKNSFKSKKKREDVNGDDQVELPEFRLLLQQLRQQFEQWVMFNRIDSSQDRRISVEEFKQAVPKLEEWGVKIEDAQASFNEIDGNGGGQVLFEEFVEWATKKNLDLEDDIDDD